MILKEKQLNAKPIKTVKVDIQISTTDNFMCYSRVGSGPFPVRRDKALLNYSNKYYSI